MTKPTHQEIIDAYDALDTLCDRVPATRSAKERILKALPPKPQPTMAEVKWDEDEHYLAEADYLHTGGQVIMLTPKVEDREICGIKCFRKKHGYTFTAHPRLLTPTGKRYTLTEVQE